MVFSIVGGWINPLETWITVMSYKLGGHFSKFWGWKLMKKYLKPPPSIPFSSSNHPFSGGMLVLGSVYIIYLRYPSTSIPSTGTAAGPRPHTFFNCLDCLFRQILCIQKIRLGMSKPGRGPGPRALAPSFPKKCLSNDNQKVLTKTFSPHITLLRRVFFWKSLHFHPN